MTDDPKPEEPEPEAPPTLTSRILDVCDPLDGLLADTKIDPEILGHLTIAAGALMLAHLAAEKKEGE